MKHWTKINKKKTYLILLSSPKQTKTKKKEWDIAHRLDLYNYDVNSF